MASLIVQCEVFDLETAQRRGVPFEFHASVSGTEPPQWVTMAALLGRVQDWLTTRKPEEVSVRKYAAGEVIPEEGVTKQASSERWTDEELEELRRENEEADRP